MIKTWLKGHGCSFGEEIHAKDVHIYNIIAVIIQTQKNVFFADNWMFVEARNMAGTATYKQGNTVCIVLPFKVSLLLSLFGH